MQIFFFSARNHREIQVNLNRQSNLRLQHSRQQYHFFSLQLFHLGSLRGQRRRFLHPANHFTSVILKQIIKARSKLCLTENLSALLTIKISKLPSVSGKVFFVANQAYSSLAGHGINISELSAIALHTFTKML